MFLRMPNFLKLPVYAFDISDQSYKYLLLKENGGRFTVEDFGEGEIQKGAIEKGEIKNPDLLRMSLSAIFAAKKIKYVALSLPEEKGFLRSIRISGVAEDEVGRALELQLEEHIPMRAEDAVFSYSIKSKTKHYFI